jgi:hypothetical protein
LVENGAEAMDLLALCMSADVVTSIPSGEVVEDA